MTPNSEKEVPAFMRKDYDPPIIRPGSALPGVLRWLGWLQIAGSILWTLSAVFNQDAPWLASIVGIGTAIGAIWWFVAALVLELLEKIAWKQR